MSTCYAVSRILDLYPELPAEYVRGQLYYSTFVNLRRGYMYFEVPKAGCTYLKSLIHRLEKLPPIDFLNSELLELRRDMFIHDRSKFKMDSIISLDDRTQRELLESADFFRFTVVRNPYARLESVWRDKVRLCTPGYEYLYFQIKGMLPIGKSKESLISFAEFIQHLGNDDLRHCNSHWRLQNYHLFHKALDFSYVGRLERFSEAVTTFVDRAKYAAPASGERMNESVGAACYDATLAETVYRLYEADFLAFGYEKESWRSNPREGEPEKPRMIAEPKLIDEMIERNIIICTLYATRQKLSRQMIEASQSYANLMSSYSQLQDQHQKLREAYETLLAGQETARVALER